MRRITWFGHATVLIEVHGQRLVTDPVFRGRIAHLRRHAAIPSDVADVDAILISHAHRDHLDRPTLRGLSGSHAVIVVPAGIRRHIEHIGNDRIREIRAGDTVRIGSADVRAVEAWHPSSRWPLGKKLEALGFVVDGIWFAGDTDLDERMAELRGAVDVALVPVWGWGPSLGPGHLDPERAARAVALVQPRVAIPIHWGTYLPYGLTRRHRHLLRTPPLEFATHVERLAPGVRVTTLSPGESVEV
jgi:L-ascorbate metabolism protein UlaG (beta-lactamase superfamily)